MGKKEKVDQMNKEMTAEEAKAFRASLYKPQAPVLTEHQAREAFRIFWASAKRKYNKSKDLESILWLHLKAINMALPEKFEAGIANFGLKRISNTEK